MRSLPPVLVILVLTLVPFLTVVSILVLGVQRILRVGRLRLLLQEVISVSPKVIIPHAKRRWLVTRCAGVNSLIPSLPKLVESTAIFWPGTAAAAAGVGDWLTGTNGCPG